MSQLQRDPIVNNPEGIKPSYFGQFINNFTNWWNDHDSGVRTWNVVKALLGNFSGQIVGTTTNNNASAGNIGEYVSSTNAGTNAPGTGQWFDVANISLTAGDWAVTAEISFNLAGATATQCNGGVSTTTGNSATGLTLGDNWLQTLVPTAITDTSVTIGSWRKSISSTTTVYLKGNWAFSAGTPNCYGRISARRVR